MLKYRRMWMGVAVLAVALVMGLVPGDSVAKINKVNDSNINGTNNQKVGVKVSARAEGQRTPAPSQQTAFTAVLVPQGTTNATCIGTVDGGVATPATASPAAASAAQAFSPAPTGKTWVGFQQIVNVPGAPGPPFGGNMLYEFDLPPSGPGLRPGDVYCVYAGITGNAQDSECVTFTGAVPSLTAPFAGLLAVALLGSGALVLRARRRARAA